MPRCHEVPTTAVPDEGTRIRRAVSSGRPETRVLRVLWMAAGEEGGWESVDCRSRRRRRRVCGAPQEREVESLGRVTDHQRGRPWDYPWLPLMMGLPLTAAEDGTTPDCPLSMGHPPGALSTGRPPGALSIGHPPGALSMGRPPGFLSLGQTARVTCATGRSCFFFL